jgi:DNA-binding response OmpR family regulator
VGNVRIALVEDDERIGSSLARALTGEGYLVERVVTGGAALELVAGDPPDLMLLDLGLPDRDGLEVAASCLAAAPNLPIIMLTARNEEIDIVLGLDSGAVDYVTKPFRLAELSARIRAHLRTRPGVPGPGLVVGDLRLDPASRRAWHRDIELTLRAKEFDLLERLVRDAGRGGTREALMSDVWDANWYGSTKTLDFHIAALRTKLDPPEGPSVITTVRGVGFRYEAP